MFVFVLAAVVIGAYIPFNQNNAEKESILIQTMIQGLNQLHYQPLALDDDFSQKAFDAYLDRIDPARRWLTQEDVVALKQFENGIDDQIDRGSFEMLDLAIERLEAGLAKTKTYFEDILSQPFDLDKQEVMNLDYENKPFAKNNEELKDYWYKSLKYETINRVYNKIKTQEKQKTSQMEDGEPEVISDISQMKDKAEAADDEPKEILTIAQMEEKAREEVLETFTDWYERMSKDRRSDHLSDYLNALTSIYDPHTNYFLPKDKANFDISMSGTLEGIGARLQTDGELTKVSSIVPGGPAWKGKDLEQNDLIVKVGQGNEEPVDITGFRIDDVVKIVRGKKGTEVKLTVRKVDGTEQVVSITRDVVQLDEGYAKSALVDVNDTGGQVGYIHLPRFYDDFQRQGGRSCANDVAAEIEKLKDHKVEGVILDLRSNGGGSLRDVVRMTGLFIEEGPIVQVKARGREPDVLSDTDKSVQYDGKLIVLVNSFSASASEILAAALQDYGRAIIIGTGKSTFGKGTVQRFFDLDRAIRGFQDVKPLGDVKLTIQKFYRVDGGSTQLRGVTPDIVLPDRYFDLMLGEQDQEFPLSWTEIQPIGHSQEVRAVKGKEKLVANSEQRVAANPTFKMIREEAARLKASREDFDYPLDLDSYTAKRKNAEAEGEKFNDILTPIATMTIKNLPEDMENIDSDEGKAARNDSWIENLQKDIYLEEAIRVLREMN